MIARIITAVLLLISFALTGCINMKETRTENKDGSVTVEKSINGWAPSAPVYVAPRVYTPVPLYGRDHYFSGRPSYDPAPPVPHVVFGDMLSGSQRAALVNGTSWRMCDIRSTAPNHCNRIEDAYKWPSMTSDRNRR